MSGPLTSQSEPIPGYRLIERIGRGGFGEVWKCEAPGGLHKAIKFVYGDLEGAGEDGKPAEQELKSLERVKSIRHPYILSLERFDIVEGQLTIIMELADRSLWDRFRECRGEGLPGIPRDELLRYLAETAEALDLMNSRYQIQHLDIKPQNVFLVHNHVKVADFGLAKAFEGMRATVTGGVTPVYAAPETFEGWISRYCDQYSLAILYQELLTGVRPFNGSNTRQLLLQHLQAPPDLAPLPAADRPAVGRALAKKPDERFPTCTELVAALRTGGTPSSVKLPLPARPPEPAQSEVVTPAGGAPPSSTPREDGVRTDDPNATTSGRRRLSELRRSDPAIARGLGAAPVTLLRPSLYQTVTAANLPRAAPPEQTGAGVLLPALVIGVGRVGNQVLRQLREAVGERVGPPERLPNLRYLAIDTDAEALQSLTTDRTVPFAAAEVFLARLNRPSHYLKPRDGSPPVESWLDPRMLYRLPRQPTTAGLRGFGRLAVCDHFRALRERLRGEVVALLDPAALPAADGQTGLGLRTTRPRIYVVAGLGGGTGGGAFLDVAYVARQALRQAGYADPQVVGVLLLPPVERGAPKSLALANAYAALTELHHFSRPDTRYLLPGDAREPPTADDGRPFARCLLLPLAAAPEPGPQRQATGRASALLFHELLAPLGRRADAERDDFARRQPPAGAFCQTAGTFRLGWPRRRLLKRTARRLARRLLRSWADKEAGPLVEPVQAWLEDQWARRGLLPEEIVGRLRETCAAAIGQAPEVKFESLVESAAGPRLEAATACAALDQLVRLVGKPSAESRDDRSVLFADALTAAAKATAAESDQKLAEMAVHFIEQPGYRLGGAEEAMRQMTAKAEGVFAAYEGLAETVETEATEVYARLLPLIGSLQTFALGTRKSAVAAEVVDLLRVYPRKRYQALVFRSVLTIYRSMLGNVPEYLHDVAFCRQRLDDVARALDVPDDGPAADAALGPGKHVFAGSVRVLDEAAAELADGLSAEELADLDGRVQAQVRQQFRALVHICLAAGDNTAVLHDLLAGQCEEFLADRLAQADPAAILLSHIDEAEARRDVADAFDGAAPELAGPRAAKEAEACILAAPDTEAGRSFRELADRALPGERLLPASATDDLVFYREQRSVPLADLPQLGPQARETYEQVMAAEGVTVHSRTDVKWLPPGRG